MTGARTIAVGYDGSPGAEVALRWALELGAQLGAEVVVVHAVGLLEHTSQTDRPGQLRALETAVQRQSDEVGPESGPVRCVLADGDPCSVLIRSADPPIGADLVVVGSRGRGAHAGRLLGSTSLELAEHSLVPVLIVPEGRGPADPADRARTDSAASGG